MIHILHICLVFFFRILGWYFLITHFWYYDYRIFLLHLCVAAELQSRIILTRFSQLTIIFYMKCHTSGFYIRNWKVERTSMSFKYSSTLFHLLSSYFSFYRLIFGLKIRDQIGLHYNMLLKWSRKSVAHALRWLVFIQRIRNESSLKHTLLQRLKRFTVFRFLILDQLHHRLCVWLWTFEKV